MNTESRTATASPRDVLIAARKLIEKPENWGQGCKYQRGDKHCLGEAIALSIGRNSVPSYWKVCDIVRGANGWAQAVGVPTFNDTHTHAEVLAAIDCAIAKATGGTVTEQASAQTAAST